jgi:FixJ family two-component response regulator
LTREFLESCGYIVLEAEDGEQALEVAEGYEGTIACLVTDVVLPKIQGTSLAKSLLQRRAGIKVLYISGYTDNPIVHSRELQAATSFLQKPFTTKELARKVRELLDDH